MKIESVSGGIHTSTVQYKREFLFTLRVQRGLNSSINEKKSLRTVSVAGIIVQGGSYNIFKLIHS